MQQYFCKNIPTSEGEDCVTCVPSDIRSMYISTETSCSSCCMRAKERCEQWSWGAVLSTLSVSIIFATCSGLLALTEKRRKRKGMSFARAWSIPQGMPIVSRCKSARWAVRSALARSWHYGSESTRSLFGRARGVVPCFDWTRKFTVCGSVNHRCSTDETKIRNETKRNAR